MALPGVTLPMCGDELNPLGAEAAAHTSSHPRQIMALADLRLD